MRITFYGGAGTVTGANFLLETKKSKILVDCGLVQGIHEASRLNRLPFAYDPSEIDFLFVTHAHLDHIGRIPKLVRDGFTGVIYSTPATKELASVMFEDALGLLEDEAAREGVLPLYEKKDIDRALSLWKEIPYYAMTSVRDVSVLFKDAGHVLGSSIIEFYQEDAATFLNNKKNAVVFTGDLGNSPALFLRDTDVISDAAWMVMESVYGDRNHQSKEERQGKLKEILDETVAHNRTLIIPAFSLERTQDLLFEINALVEHGAMRPVPVFLDSPLASRVTEIYRRSSDLFNDVAKQMIRSGDDLFDFPKLRLTNRIAESRAIWGHPGAKVIIAGSGMSNGGRVIFHEERYVSDAKATILFVGYQAAGTLGRALMEAKRKVLIGRREVTVRATIKSIEGYSAHKDSNGLLDFVSHSASTLKKVFITMGEPKSSLFLAQRVHDYLGVEAHVPLIGETWEEYVMGRFKV